MSVQILSQRHYASIYYTLNYYVASTKMNEYCHLLHVARESMNQPYSMRQLLLSLILNMYELNCKAYEQKYLESVDDLLTGEMIMNAGILLEPTELYKALAAWRYNSVYCIDGGIRNYKRMTPAKIKNVQLACDLTSAIAEAIVRRTESYDIAKWTL